MDDDTAYAELLTPAILGANLHCVDADGTLPIVSTHASFGNGAT